MDGSRFDALTRALAGGGSRRGFVAGVLGLGAGLLADRSTVAATCPPGQIYRARVGCICQATGRPPGGPCPCPPGLTDTGDGQGCLVCRGPADCPTPDDPCLVAACVDGACGVAPGNNGTQCDTGKVCSGGVCLGNGVCTEPDPNADCGPMSCAIAPATGTGCGPTIEGAVICNGNGFCRDFDACGGSDDCPPGFVCMSGGCSKGPVCVPICA